ncbi:MAG: PTS sugar transporter subunit IIA [Elusimicrobia bacterium]|nr:PTS sugar transporter subunit IIA [Elusimicrobiota bacterium]MDE2236775.1 PTS sugar transporter subunit IIA [Elusimicrobiota bacterium]MDE2426367.1 PTS sugar transporter subunit IIA [Elusimicrobiota bacterium]
MAWFKRGPQPGPQSGSQPARPPAARIDKLLNERAILFPTPGLEKPALLEAAVAACCTGHGLGQPAPFLARVREREEGISTTLDIGLSLPHARVDGLERIAAALALLPHGAADPRQPGVTIRAMFLFFSPNRREAFTSHLQVLRGVSSLFARPGFFDSLLALREPAQVLELLRRQAP